MPSLADEGRPRAVVVCGMGGSGIAGDLLAAVAGRPPPRPSSRHRGYGLPAWVGAADLVVAVSCTGRDRGDAVGARPRRCAGAAACWSSAAADSPLAELAARGRAVVVPVPQGRQPRASVWSLTVPLVAAGHCARPRCRSAPDDVEEAAPSSSRSPTRCRPDADTVVNPAKALATELSRRAAGGVGLLAARRGRPRTAFACQLNENAGGVATWGTLPEAGHNQVVALDGPGRAGRRARRTSSATGSTSPSGRRCGWCCCATASSTRASAVRADAVADLAAERGVGVSALRAEGDAALARLASLVGTTDFASAYLALLEGTDPTPVHAIAALKQRIGPA